MLKNKKILLSSIAIVFALVVSAIFVNFTLANSGSTASVSDVKGSGSTEQPISDRTNIDWAIENSRDTTKQKNGQARYNIVQIVSNSDDSKKMAKADMDVKAYYDKLYDKTYKKTTGDITPVNINTGNSWLCRYVYGGEYFRCAVFNGYKSENNSKFMAKTSVSLSTYTVSDLSKMDSNAKSALEQADLVYIHADSADDYGKNGDLSEDLYNWLDAYATADSHPIIISKGALCTADPTGIIGNNDDYRMGAFAYKIMTKTYAARYDNVLVTDPDFFQRLYDEAKKKDNGGNTPNPSTNYTLTDFILRAKPVKEGGANYIGLNTYFKWYQSVTIQNFLQRKGLDSSMKDSLYVKARDRSGLTGDKNSWPFDHAKILVISENDVSSMFTEMKPISDNEDSGNSENRTDRYTYDEATATWKSVETAPNSELTSYMYSQGRVDDSLGLSPYVPSAAEIYQIDSANLRSAMTDGTKGFRTASLPKSHYSDIKTKNISGTITSTHPETLNLGNCYAYLLIEDVQETKDENGKVTKVTTVHPAGDAGSEYTAPLKKSTTPKKDENGDIVYDENGEVVEETCYTYEFTKLNYNYNYRVVIDIPSEGVEIDNPDTHETMVKHYVAGVSSLGGYDNSTDTDSDDSAYYTYDFNLRYDDDDLVDGFYYRTETKPESGMTDATYMLAVTHDDFNANVGATGLDKGYSADLISDYIRFADVNQVVAYVDKSYQDYVLQQTALVGGADGTITSPSVLELTDFDFIFIDKGLYFPKNNKDDISKYELGKDVYDQFVKAIEKNLYFIVSSEAGNSTGSQRGSDDDTPSDSDTNKVINSPLAKPVADVINAGTYRDGFDNKFRVLEIQPDYPIDLEVAASKADVTTAYTKRSDGTAITGDYYTVPSDVVSGKSKEELAEGTEYYQFDLTKAKIAYAIDGVSYGDVQLTQVSTEQLIGMKEDISATYDLVYIGGDISAMDRDPSQMYTGQKQVGSYASVVYTFFPTFIMYYHTGMLNKVSAASSYSMDTSETGTQLLATPQIEGTVYDTAYLPENGNDLTLTKYNELMDYISSGRPVIVSDELSSVYDKMQGVNANGQKLSYVQLMQGYWYNGDKIERKNYYLDPSSRMYQLVGNIKNKITSGKATSILWGFDVDGTKQINDADGTYGVSLRDYTVVMDDAMSVAVNNLVNSGSQKRTRVTVIDRPTTYQEGIESSFISTNRLDFRFQVDGNQEEYDYEIYVDKDKNTVFDDQDYLVTGKAKNGVEVTKQVILDDEFFGSAAWCLRVKSGSTVIAVQTGISKIVNNNVKKSAIKVLQIQTMSEGQDSATWSSRDTLYFDIGSQTAHKICKYNFYSNNTDFDVSSPKQYKVLGRHENRFGIYEYDMSTDKDDYFSNLADQLTSDYDIDLDMVVAADKKVNVKGEDNTSSQQSTVNFTTADGQSDSYDCMDTMVEEAEILDKGGKVGDYTQEEYVTHAAIAQTEYDRLKEATKAPKKELDKYIDGAITLLNTENGYTDGNSTYGKKGQDQTFLGGFNSNNSKDDIVELLEYVKKTGDYYLMFWPVYSVNSNLWSGNEIGTVYGTEFQKLFTAYRDAKDLELNAKDKYNTYLRRSYGKNFLKKMYSIIVLGPSDSFGGFKVDLEEKTCEYILDYVSAGGDLFFFHDSMTPFADKGAVHLTKALLSVVGMNRFHVDLTDNANSYTVTNDAYAKGIRKTGLVKGTVGDDGELYVMRHITNGLEKDQLYQDGDIYTKLNGASGDSESITFMKEADASKDGTDIYYRLLVNPSISVADKIMYRNVLTESSDDVYVKSGISCSDSSPDTTTYYANATNIPAGTTYYINTGYTCNADGLINGTAKAGEEAYDWAWKHQNDPDWQVVNEGVTVIYSNSNSSQYQQAGTFVKRTATEDMNDVYIWHNASEWTELSYMNQGNNISKGYFIEAKSDGTSSGYVEKTLIKYPVYDGNWAYNVAYFEKTSGKAGDTVYSLVDTERYQYYTGNGLDTSYFVKNLKCYNTGYEKMTAQKYDYYDGSKSTGYFTKASAKKGTKGYVMVTDAKNYTYYENESDFESYGELQNPKSKTGLFSKEKADKGTKGYVMKTAGAVTGDTTTTSLEYKAPSGQEDKYYLTPYAFNNLYGSGLVNSMHANYTDWIYNQSGSFQAPGREGSIYVSALSMSALYQNGNDNSATSALPYVYAQEQFQSATAWSMAANANESACSETVKASQLNSGLVTLYPYSISSSLNISGTHQQAYALDLESNKVTVWYTLAGANNTGSSEQSDKSSAKVRSSKYAASPGDAMESYFIYTTAYGSGAITYCGAGHSSVTGRGTRNNDERKLFINVIVNSAAAVPDMPSIKCYEPTEKWDADNELSRDSDGVYQRVLDAKTDVPTFDYRVSIPEDTKVTQIKIFYDLDYNKNCDYTETPSFNDKTDKEILSYTAIGDTNLAEITSEIKAAVRDGENVALKPQDSYFTAYGGSYTYIVVQVYYEGGKEPVYAMIKVKASDPLFNLTDNTIDVPTLGDALPEKKSVQG